MDGSARAGAKAGGTGPVTALDPHYQAAHAVGGGLVLTASALGGAAEDRGRHGAGLPVDTAPAVAPAGYSAVADQYGTRAAVVRR